MAAPTGYHSRDPSGHFLQKRQEWESTKRSLEEKERITLDEQNSTRREMLLQSDREKQHARKEWERYGKELHKRNIRVKKGREAADESWTQKVETQGLERTRLTNGKAKSVVDNEIDAFETRLTRMGLDAKSKRANDGTMDADAKEAALELKRVIASQNEVPFKHMEKLGTQARQALAETEVQTEQYVKKIQQRKLEDTEARREREKRRRKMLLDQQKNFRDIDEKRREDIMLHKLLRVSKQERAIAQDLCQQSNWKDVIVKNRAEREQQYAERRRRDYEEEMERRHELAEKERREYVKQTEAERKKWQDMWDAKQELKKQKHYDMCLEITEQVVQLAEKVIHYSERTGERQRMSQAHLVPKPLWRQWMTLFRNGESFESEPEDEIPEVPEEVEEVPVNEDKAAITKLLNEAELKDYVEYKDEWKSTRPWVQEYNPQLMSIMCRLQKITNPDPPPFQPANTKTIKIVMLGKPLSGKSAIGKALAESLGLAYMTSRSIIEDATADFNPEADKAAESLPDAMRELYTEHLNLGRGIRRQLLDGQTVGELSLIPIVMNRLKYIELEGTKKGYLLDGIPSTEEGFKRMEYFLSGYNEEEKVSIKPKLLLPHPPAKGKSVPSGSEADAVALESADGSPRLEVEDVDSSNRPESSNSPPAEEEMTPPDESGFDLVVYVDCPNSAIFSRFAGQRQDPSSGTLYHMEYNPPPLDRVASLQPVDRPNASDQAMLQEKLMTFSHEVKRIRKWVERYGNMITIDGDKRLTAMQTEIQGLFEKLCVEKEAKYAARIAKAEAEEKKLLDALQAVEVDQLLAEETPTPAETPTDPRRGSRRLSNKLAAVAAAAPSENGEGGPVMIEMSVLDENEKKLDDSIAGIFQTQWDNIEVVFEKGVAEVFTTLRRLSKKATEHFVVLQSQFREYLVRPDNKQAIVAAFQTEFNSIDQIFKADVDTKQELHLRTDQLQETLWQMNDARRDACKAELQAYKDDEWLVVHKRSITRQLIQLMQIEVDRFMQSRVFILDYHYLVCGVDNSEDNVPVNFDIMVKSEFADTRKGGKKDAKKDEKQPAKGKDDKAAKGGKPDAKGKGPKVAEEAPEEEDILSIAFDQACAYVRTPWEEGAEDDAKDAKKDKKKGKKQAEEEEKPPRPIPPRMKEILEVEMDLALRRLDRLKEKCQKRLEEIIEKSGQLYGTMNEWLILRYKEEMQAVASLIKQIRESIEEENPLPYELRLEGTEFIMDQDVMLLEVPKPAKFSKPEASDPEANDLVVTWLTKSQALYLVSKFRQVSPLGAICKDDFTRLFLQVTAMTYGAEHIPAMWAELKRQHFDFVFDGFDIFKKGIIDWREFMCSVLLWSNPRLPGAAPPKQSPNPFMLRCPSLAELVTLRDAFSKSSTTSASTEISQEAFMATPFWFESIVGDVKSAQLKAILWSIFYVPVEIKREATKEKEAPKDKGAAKTPELSVTPEPAEEDPASVDYIHYPTLLLFLCIDPQIIRGGQKAFAMLADQEGVLDKSKIYSMFHFSSISPSKGDETVDDVTDEFSWDIVDSVFEEVSLSSGQDEPAGISFQQMCNTHIGRVLLNTAKMYLKKEINFC